MPASAYCGKPTASPEIGDPWDRPGVHRYALTSLSGVPNARWLFPRYEQAPDVEKFQSNPTSMIQGWINAVRYQSARRPDHGCGLIIHDPAVRQVENQKPAFHIRGRR